MAFYSCEFTFDGESSYMHGLMLCGFGGSKQNNVSFGNEANIIESKTNKRIQPIHLGVNYNNTPLQFKLIFGAERALDRYELEDIGMWLTGHQNYKWLTIDQPDLSNVAFRCIITKLTPLQYGGYPAAFEATVRCDCPYAYSYPFEMSYTIRNVTNILFRNESSIHEYFKPIITFQPTSQSNLSIVNNDDNDREFLIDYSMTNSMFVSVDNVNGIILETNHGTNLYPYFNMNFLRLVHGDNHLTVTGNGLLKISGRFLYNVAG